MKKRRLIESLDKGIEDYRESLSKWTGEGHYQNDKEFTEEISAIEPIDLAASKRRLVPFGITSIIKYADRHDSPSVPLEKRETDLLKIGHYCGLMWQVLQAEKVRLNNS